MIPMIPNTQNSRCEACPSRAATCTLDPTSSFTIPTSCVDGYKLVNQACISAKECEPGYYVSYLDETCTPCAIGMETCHFDFNRWTIVATGCITNFEMNEYKTCVVSNQDLY